MIRRRGLTLLEVLIATAIMTMIAAACAPAVREAADALRATETSIDEIELAAVIDAWLEEQSESLSDLTEEDLLTIDAPIAALDQPVTLRILRANAEDADHGWIIAQCGSVEILRWFFIDVEEDDSDAEGTP